MNNGKIVIEPIKKTARKGWSESFIKMAENNEDDLLTDDAFEIEMIDWEW